MPHHGLRGMLRELAEGGWRSRIRPEPFRFAGRSLLPGWSVATRLGEITVPTLVIAGREDFIFRQNANASSSQEWPTPS